VRQTNLRVVGQPVTDALASPGKERAPEVVYVNYTDEDHDWTAETKPSCSASDPALALGSDVRSARVGARNQRLWVKPYRVGIACDDDQRRGRERDYHDRSPGPTTARS
jgi:hypothetical protein